MFKISKTWFPPNDKNLNDVDSHNQWLVSCYYSNGYCWAKGTKTSITIKGRETIWWKLGFWRGGGRKPALKYYQQDFSFLS